MEVPVGFLERGQVGVFLVGDGVGGVPVGAGDPPDNLGLLRHNDIGPHRKYYISPSCPPHLQVLPAAEVVWGELSGAGAMVQFCSSGQSSIGHPSDEVGRASSEGSLLLRVSRAQC